MEAATELLDSIIKNTDRATGDGTQIFKQAQKAVKARDEAACLGFLELLVNVSDDLIWQGVFSHRTPDCEDQYQRIRLFISNTRVRLFSLEKEAASDGN